MGRRGPAPTPTKILALRDSWLAKTRNDEPKPPVSTPRCPSWLDVEAKARWKHIVPKLADMGLLAAIDGDALVNYCQTWSRWKQAEQFIAQHGPVYPIKDDKGNVKYLQQVPQVSIAKGLVQVLSRYQQEFGMTPSARTRIEVPNQKEQAGVDEFDAFINRGKRSG